MKIAGIIAEYNPFHHGHAHQIALLRAQGYDAVVCVCSPSVVQRGAAALLPTAVRTRAALLGGADLVLSLPAPYATLSAEGFARAGVQLLAALGVCEVVAFGAENTDTGALLQAARVLQGEAFSAALPQQLAAGVSFATARTAAADAVQPGLGALLRTPNNILGVEYCKALLELGAGDVAQGAGAQGVSGVQDVPDAPDALLAADARKLADLPNPAHAQGKTVPRPLALPREGAQHDAPLPGAADTPEKAFASATALRALFLMRGAHALAPYVPAPCLALYEQAQRDGLVTDSAAFGIAVLSRLRAMNTAAFAAVRGACEGLDSRLAAAVRTASTLDALYDALKTKRYAHARVRRLALDAALGYTAALPAAPPYLHVLGARETGLAVLRQAKSAARLPLSQSLAQLTQTGPAACAVAEAHAAAEDLAALCLRAPQPQGSAFTEKFIMV